MLPTSYPSFNFAHSTPNVTSLWDKLFGDTSGHGSRISIETIRLLHFHVVWYVKNLIYRAIAFREQERTLKSETKVWKLSGKAVGDQSGSGICLHTTRSLISSS
jgi:hypothetical protein